jgi:hypothetical protein
MQGYDQLVKVTGKVTIGGVERSFEGRGQRGHSWGAPDWDKLTMARTLGVWLEGDAGVTLTAVRPAKASSHADEAIHAVLLGRDGETDEQLSLVVADPRVSTTYDSEGRQRHAGLEKRLHANSFIVRARRNASRPERSERVWLAGRFQVKRGCDPSRPAMCFLWITTERDSEKSVNACRSGCRFRPGRQQTRGG